MQKIYFEKLKKIDFTSCLSIYLFKKGNIFQTRFQSKITIRFSYNENIQYPCLFHLFFSTNDQFSTFFVQKIQIECRFDVIF